MKMNLEGNLITVNKKFVNIDDHREEFTKHYDALRTMLYIKLQKCNPVLEKLLKGHTLGGSYGDNLKVAMPNEFDLVLHLIFPENDKIIVKADRKKPGNVTLDMSKVMEIIGNQEHNKSVFQQLQKMVTKNQMLCEDKLQSWLQGVMTKALNNFQIQVGTETSSLCYKRCGPAHTIFVTGRYEYSVDFVPAIRLKATQAVLPTSQQRYFQGTPHWDAIPKPINAENISFRASYYDAEKKILHNRNNLKNAIRLMKQLRDTKNNMANLKSYYIKTLFLWESVQQPITYWDNSVSQIVIQMMEKLRITFKPMGKLKFFWDPELNMIADLTDNQRKAIYQCVVGSQKTFFWGDGDLTGATVNKVHSLFDNREERNIENKPPNCPSNKVNPKMNQDAEKKTEHSLTKNKPSNCQSNKVNPKMSQDVEKKTDHSLTNKPNKANASKATAPSKQNTQSNDNAKCVTS